MGGRAANLQWPSVLRGGGNAAKDAKLKQKRPVMFEIGMDWEGSEQKGKGKGRGSSASWHGIEVSRFLFRAWYDSLDALENGLGF